MGSYPGAPSHCASLRGGAQISWCSLREWLARMTWCSHGRLARPPWHQGSSPSRPAPGRHGAGETSSREEVSRPHALRFATVARTMAGLGRPSSVGRAPSSARKERSASLNSCSDGWPRHDRNHDPTDCMSALLSMRSSDSAASRRAAICWPVKPGGRRVMARIRGGRVPVAC